jgi:sialate O-acetylesterase
MLAMTHRVALLSSLVLALVLQIARPAAAAIQTNALFSDNAVLQQKVKVPVWGTTDSNEPVMVSIAGQQVQATPQDGKWRVELAPLEAGGPHTLKIAQCSDVLERKNILVGEVWLCGGQSNMQWPLHLSYGGDAAAAASANDKIRLITIPRERDSTPRENVNAAWEVAGPETTPQFSAVAYYFGRDLQNKLGVPIGLISSNVGGTAAEEWIGGKTLAAHNELEGQFTPPGGASQLYNAMIAPLAPYAIQGVIWYQGESNAGRAFHYRKLLPAMIESWRETFNNPNMSFHIVQIAPYDKEKAYSPDTIWAEIRDAQFHVVKSVPNTSLIVTIDVGDEQDIHPRQKLAVGERLALAARKLAYGEDIEHSGPLYASSKVEGDKIRLSFDHVGGGLLAIKGELKGFTIAGEDQKFHKATAKIEGDTVVVSSSEVPKPVAVRYAWLANPEGNLWNRAGLTASPFRTDEFPITTQNNR